MSRPLKDRPDVRFFTEVALIDQLSRQRVERALPDGLSAASFSVLNRFARLGGTQSPAELAAAFQVTKGAMTNTLQRLEEQGLVKVEADPADGRRKRVTLTEAGARRHTECLSALKPPLDRVRGAFPEAEFEAALPFLEALRAWLDANR
ncbi:MAG: MarR family transcriptional regulator [Proteobacteria bacterium]|nr:MarR family transcriptional regulator [Pseudomonadota bacterium]